MSHKKIMMEPDKKRLRLSLTITRNKTWWSGPCFQPRPLAHHEVFATGTTGEMLERELGFKIAKLPKRSTGRRPAGSVR